MAKVAFSKLKCKINDTEVPVQIGEETIMVKQYLPIQEKLELIGQVIEQAHEQNYNYNNPIKVNVYLQMAIVFAYTNLSFTDKQKEDLPKTYDLLASNNIMDQILSAIPADELNELSKGLDKTIQSFYAYQNSILGILELVKTEYNNVDFDIVNLINKFKDSDIDLDLVKGLLTNLN